MNRLIICIILLLGSHAVLAEKLYRWIEPDGSITFSPKPPPAGVDYKAVNAANNNAAVANLPATTQQRSILATSEHGLDTTQMETNTTEILARPAPAVSKQKLSYAPETGSNGNKIITSAAALPQPTQPAESHTASVDSSNKRRQCQDLSKRVLSLERRLRSTLEPVDMDNTVVAMARYQKSYDQHCID